jgi:repressor LexA
MSNTLTARQTQVLEFIRSHLKDRGYGPTIRDIGAALNITSPNGVVCHLKALRKKGFLTQPAAKTARCIVPTEKAQ